MLRMSELGLWGAHRGDRAAGGHLLCRRRLGAALRLPYWATAPWGAAHIRDVKFAEPARPTWR